MLNTLQALRLALVGAMVAAVASPISAANAAPWKWTPEAMVDVAAVGNAAIAPDGSTIVFTRSRWRAEGAKPGAAYLNLWRVPSAGGTPQRLTTADTEDSSPRFAPDGARIAFLSRRGGDQPKTRVWLLSLSGGEPEALTDEKTEVASFAWAPDGRTIAYIAVDAKSDAREKAEKVGNDAVVVGEENRPRRLWIFDLASRKGEKLASLGELSAWDLDWAPDSSALVATVTDRNRTDESYMRKRVAVLPRKGARRELVGVVGKVAEVRWSKDGKTVAYNAGVDASDPAPGSLFVVPAAGGAARNLTGAREELVEWLAWRPDGKLAVATVVGTRAALSLVDPATGASDAAVRPGVAAFASFSLSADGTRCAFVGSTPAHPWEVFAGPLGGGDPKRVTDTNPQIAALPRGAQEIIRYKAKDGLEIEAVLIRPVGFRAGVRYPLVVVAHGGPEAQYLDGWNQGYSTPSHAFAERGYMVLLPNYRGSTGRGVAFQKADHKDLGGKEFTDLLDGVDHLAAKGWVDAKRVGITGGSYGGYFTAIGVTRHSDRFAAGVDLFGISNWDSYMGQTDIPVENAAVHWALWCYEHADLCRDRSPVSHVQRARTPTLILQGQDDARVPRGQSDELYAALRWKKVPVEYVTYPREGHGFRERWHRLDTVTRLLGWMDRYLAGPPRS